MRSCQCYHDRKVNDFNSKGLDAFDNKDADAPQGSAHHTSKHGKHSLRHKSSPKSAEQGAFKRAGYLGDPNTGSRTHSRASSVVGDMSFSNAQANTLQDVLTNLKTFKDQGLIDEDEYKASKSKILNIELSPFSGRTALAASHSLGFPSTTNQRTYTDPRLVMDVRKTQQKGQQQILMRGQDAREVPLSITSSSLTDDEDEPGHPGVKRIYLDFLFKQLRTVCYRKVRGNGNDVSIREIFRHFDSEKHGEAPGIDKDEFVLAVRRLMLGSAARGIITEDEAVALFARIDADHSGTIDYRETAASLSLPGWDNKVLGKKSNILL